MNVVPNPHLDLSLRRIFNVTPERLFRAWTDADELVKWFGPDGVTTEIAEVDLTIGGAYRLVMRLPQGDEVIHHGVYREILANKKLVFTWVLDGQSCDGSESESCETVVTVFFNNQDEGTELVIIHDFLPSETSRDNHSFGWTGCVESLEKLLAQEV